ncbi:MAG: sulfatase [Verrucomicrobiales bacterium]
MKPNSPRPFSFRHITPLLVALILVGTTALPLHAEDAPRPNFIVINIDDLGYGDIGPYGSDNPTPHLDRMAEEGRLLTAHYAAPVCTPSRAALLTGSYPKRALPIPRVCFPAAAVGLHPDEITIAEVLREAGYATACFGKWHLGDQPGFLPTDQGFDTYFGIPYSNDMGPVEDGAKTNPGQDPPSPEQIAKRTATNRQQYDELGIRGYAQPPMPLLEDDKVVGRVRAEEQAGVTRLYTERAVDYIREKRDDPFFLYVPHSAVHFPLYPSEDFAGKSPNGLIGDWAVEVDWSVGRILDTVRELGLSEKTLVLFTSDNGGALNHGSNNDPLRGSKNSTWEGGIRGCSVAWWPGKIPAGTRTDAMTAMMDILPTFAAFAGAEAPADRVLDGVDIRPVLTGDPETPPRDRFLYHKDMRLEAVRDGPWKLHLALADGAPGEKRGKPRPQLFHLGDDIGETRDVSAEHPEIVEKLQAIAAETDADLGVDGVGPGCRELGRVEDPMPFIADDGAVRPDAVGETPVFP